MFDASQPRRRNAALVRKLASCWSCSCLSSTARHRAGSHRSRAAAASEAETLESIVVTARRRAESLQDTPVAITALSADALERQQIVSTTDLDKVAPNLQFHSYGTLTGNNSAAQVFIRGIGQTDATPAVDPGVGIYIDDVYMGRSVGARHGISRHRQRADPARPAGNLVRPQHDRRRGAAHHQRARRRRRQFRARGPGRRQSARSLRRVRHAAGRRRGPRALALGMRQRDGYVTRVSDGEDLGDEDMYTGQVALRWKPSDAFNVHAARRLHQGRRERLAVRVPRDERRRPPSSARRASPRAARTCSIRSRRRCWSARSPIRAAATTRRRWANSTTAARIPASSTLENRGASLVANWNVNDTWSFKSITADRRLEWTGTRDADNTPLLILHTNYTSESDQFSQELQAVRRHGSPRWRVRALLLRRGFLRPPAGAAGQSRHVV